MEHTQEFYIDGRWVAPLTSDTLDVINPATEQPIATIAMGGPDDVDAAVAAAKRAFETFSLTTREERLALLDSIIGVYAGRMDELADIISQEVGAPLWLAQAAQAAAGLGHLATARAVLADFEFERPMGTTLLVREPIGVCGMITPWNWPLNQIACKVAPAIATGCTMVLKPSEVAPLNAILFAQIMHDATEYTNAHYDELMPLISSYTKMTPAEIRASRRVPATPSLEVAEIQPVIDAAARYHEIERPFPAAELLLPGAF